MGRFLAFLLAALLALAPFAPAAQAGSSQAGAPILPAGQVAAFADKVQADLAARGARVAIVSRMGRDPGSLPPGVRYTHVAYWVFSEIRKADGTTGTGYRVYNLYQTEGDRARSTLVQDSPAEFFAGAHRLDAGVVIPDARVQAKLLRTIASPTYRRLHNPRYAVLANPADPRFQNCTEHTLDVLMAALYGTGDRAQIKSNIAAHFAPQPIQLGAAKRGLAGIASRALTTEDHGRRVATATFGSIERFMRGNGLLAASYRITP
ncbi:DUF2145 domain-containing protein [Jannaschia sp. Os4]|uniref:DUF2145 domain-containing protein n=1 Tax=Jannaschia sp. Os4 TaxID=2807617 RepID=UPI001939874B|nr:DUF2145 domain-containing protein [Jannaschia sp. Os4]MBM2577341.1 DUF2145 domain-containing protein [Jannaschia sp. Os4]